MHFGHFIRKASKDSVIDGVKYIKKFYIPKQKLLAASNPLKLNWKTAIRNHSDATKSFIITPTQFKTYIASSSLAHLLDGWMYLSNSFTALLNGDEGTSIHLAYYAELRSAMSILATEGIGVFDKKHIGVFESNQCEIFKFPRSSMQKGATHQFVWNAMEKWTDSASKPNIDLLKIFHVRGRDFYELTEFFHHRVSSSNLSARIIKSWLKEWSFDIKNYREDREDRNEVSYRPQRIENFSHNLDFKNIIESLTSFWSSISPLGTDRFDLLDKYLLRMFFRNLYSQFNLTDDFRGLIDNAFTQLGIYDNSLINFLGTSPPYNQHVIFRHASSKDNKALSIIARATLLLRIAIGSVSYIFQEGEMTKSDLNFIWNNYATDNGFWKNGNIPNDFNDLWTDVETPLSDLLNDIQSSNRDMNIQSIKQRLPIEIIHLGQINRACMWGLNF